MTRSVLTRPRRKPCGHAAWPPAGEQRFNCLRCQLPVSCTPGVAAVQNRNHCPSCLWSRHMDWRTAGDRLSSCRAPMEAVGLTTKRSHNKYARERDGELMLIHRCTGCERLVINRVAADDSPEAMLELLERARALAPSLACALDANGVAMLGPADHDLVWRRLFGAGQEL